MLLKFVLILSFLLCTWAIDKTLVSEEKGEDVVCDVIKKIEKSLIFAGDEKMLRRIAYVESKFGEDRGTYRKGYHGGIWKIDKNGFDDVISSGSHPKLDQLWSKIENLLYKQKENIKWEELRKPLFSGVFARIRLYLVSDGLPASNDLGGQAKYWKSQYNSVHGIATADDFIQQVNEMNKKLGSDCNMCKGRMNLAIVMDGSGSIGFNDYGYAKQAAAKFIYLLSNEFLDVGYVLFSDMTEVRFPLKSNLTRDQMIEEINKSRYPDSGTRTDLGINEGVTILGKTDSHTGTPKIMVVFTDGAPDNAQLTISAAEQAKKSNITIFAVGIGDNIDENNLKSTASQELFVIPVASYERLIELTDKINSATCSVPQTPDIGCKMGIDHLSENEKRFFKFPLPGQGVTLCIHNDKGKVKGYYSYTVENPSSAINDGEFDEDFFISPLKANNERVKRDVQNAGSRFVYVTIQGQEDSNVYSLDTIEGNHTSRGDQLKTSILCVITSFILFLLNNIPSIIV